MDDLRQQEMVYLLVLKSFMSWQDNTQLKIGHY
jgi:hypothetical protein